MNWNPSKETILAILVSSFMWVALAMIALFVFTSVVVGQEVSVRHYIAPVECEADACTQLHIMVGSDDRAARLFRFGTEDEVENTVAFAGPVIAHEMGTSVICFQVDSIGLDTPNPPLRAELEQARNMHFCYSWDAETDTILQLDLTDGGSETFPPEYEWCGEQHLIDTTPTQNKRGT